MANLNDLLLRSLRNDNHFVQVGKDFARDGGLLYYFGQLDADLKVCNRLYGEILGVFESFPALTDLAESFDLPLPFFTVEFVFLVGGVGCGGEETDPIVLRNPPGTPSCFRSLSVNSTALAGK